MKFGPKREKERESIQFMSSLFLRKYKLSLPYNATLRVTNLTLHIQLVLTLRAKTTLRSLNGSRGRGRDQILCWSIQF